MRVPLKLAGFILVLGTLAACTMGGLAQSPTATPPAIPTRPNLTATASATGTITPTGTITLTPTSTVTSTPTDTLTPTNTITPTITLTPSITPTPTNTLTPTVTNTPRPTPVVNAQGYYELDRRYTGTFSYVGPNARAIFERGQALGRDPHRIMRIGDSEAQHPAYLNPFDTGDYYLGNYDYLSGVITYFRGSFSRASVTVFAGSNPQAILDPTWADRTVCLADETPLACEIRVQNPAIALVLTRTWVGEGGGPGTDYEEDLRVVVQYLIDQGVIPVLSTHLHHIGAWPPSEPINETIRLAARDYQVPLWDLYVTAEKTHARGNDDGNHLEVHPNGEAALFYGDYMNYAKTRQNLEALEVLHALMTLVIRP